MDPDTGPTDSQSPTTRTAPGTTPGSSESRSDARGRVREVVGLFGNPDALQKAIDELSLAGFQRHELSLLANDQTVRDQLGRVPDRVEEVEHDPNAPRQSYVAPEDTGNAQGVAIGFPAYVGAILATGAVLASGGTVLAAAAAAAAAGVGGGALGSVMSSWLTDKRNEPMLQQIDKGGILLWVNIADPERERVAVAVINRHALHPAELHEVPQTGSNL